MARSAGCGTKRVSHCLNAGPRHHAVLEAEQRDQREIDGDRVAALPGTPESIVTGTTSP